MYVAPHFREGRVDVLHRTIDEVRFATLITSGADGPIASHIPMYVEPEPGPFGTLYGHIAKANAQWRESTGTVALATFLGPYAYVTPAWYEAKKLTGKVVPTWNYIAVQARGPVEFFHEPELMRKVVSRLTDDNEADRERPWSTDDAPEDYVVQMMHGIVGVRVRISALEGAWKLSQNRPETDRAHVVEGLSEAVGERARALAEAIRAAASKV